MSEPTPRRSGYARMLDRAMRILAVRDHGEQELRRKLTASLGDGTDARDASPDDLERVIAQCIEHHWIDDNRFAQRYLAGRSRKGYGPQRIRQELQQKGVARESIDAALATSDADWESLALAFATKKFGEPLPSAFAQKAKVQRFLLYRGFYMEDIQSIYRNFNV